MSDWSWWSFGVGVLVGGVQIILFDLRAARDRRRWLARWRKIYPDETTRGPPMS